MNKKRKILGMTAAIAVIVGLLMVSIPAEEKEKTDNDCGCGCNKAPAQGEPLNFNKVLEKTVGWENDVEMLGKEIKEKKEELLKLYKKAKDGKEVLDEISSLRSEIEKLEREYWYKKEILFEIEVIQKYTELQDDGTLKIVRESLPEIENLDFEMAFSRNGSQFMGEKRIQKEAEIYDLLERAKKGEDVWNEIERLESEISSIEEKEREYRREYLESRIIKIASETPTPRFTWYCPSFMCGNKDDPLPAGHHYLKNFSKVKVWIGMYDSPTPSENTFIGEYCTTYFTTNMEYYLREAVQRNPDTDSIQIKWFYLAYAPWDYRYHDIIWEGNKSTNPNIGEWYTYAEYLTTNPTNGLYELGAPCCNKMVCCYNGGCHWCNDHCNSCFACDSDACQHFVTENP